jgi:dUTP pyrophosphatase
MIVKFKLLVNEARKPKKAHPDDAAFDVFSAQAGTVMPKGSLEFRTGIAMQLPQGYYGKFASRSGLAFKHDIHCFHGTVDNGYRGEMMVKLFNYSNEPFRVEVGDRIAQLVILPYLIADGIEVAELDETVRGTNGFGSTGGIAHGITKDTSNEENAH